MMNKTLWLVLLFLTPATVMAQQPTSQAPQASVTPLSSKDLPDLPGKEALMITVEYPPGSVDPIHRHNAHAFIYVLEGPIIMQVKGGREVTLGYRSALQSHRRLRESIRRSRHHARPRDCGIELSSFRGLQLGHNRRLPELSGRAARRPDSERAGEARRREGVRA